VVSSHHNPASSHLARARYDLGLECVLQRVRFSFVPCGHAPVGTMGAGKTGPCILEHWHHLKSRLHEESFHLHHQPAAIFGSSTKAANGKSADGYLRNVARSPQLSMGDAVTGNVAIKFVSSRIPWSFAWLKIRTC
jgi:hypothetical protein